jgi:hypothetical protein
MLQINYVRQTGVSGLTAVMYFEFLFDNATELPAGSYPLEETNYLIAENSIAVDTDGSSWYKFDGKKWIKQLSSIPKLTDSTNISTNGNYNLSNNAVRGLKDVNVNVNSGTDNYEDLSNKPMINSVELIGDKTGQELNLVGKKTIEGGEIFNDYSNNGAMGENSTAVGTKSYAYGNSSHAEGWGMYTIDNLLPIGSATDVYSKWSETSSNRCKLAYGGGSHAEGNGTLSLGVYSHAEGQYTVAYGDYSHTEGATCEAHGMSSHAEGTGCMAHGKQSHAEGRTTIVFGDRGHAEGNNSWEGIYLSWPSLLTTKPSISDVLSKWNTKKFPIVLGDCAHGEGQDCLALGTCSHAENQETVAYGYQAHAEGYKTCAVGTAAHAEGYSSNPVTKYTTSANTLSNSTSMTSYWINNRDFSYASTLGHCEGTNTMAAGTACHAEGFGTIADGTGQTACGQYNKHDNSNKYYFIVGNGSNASNPSNAFAVGRDGTIYIKDANRGELKLIFNQDGTVTWTSASM